MHNTHPTPTQHTGNGTTAEGVAASWATVRSEVLKDAVEVHLLPMLEAEARRLLKQRAEEGVLREAGQALRRVVETGMYLGGCLG